MKNYGRDIKSYLEQLRKTSQRSVHAPTNDILSKAREDTEAQKLMKAACSMKQICKIISSTYSQCKNLGR